MAPGRPSTKSDSTNRKRNTVETGFLRTDEERAAKRSRVPSHVDDEYARPITQGLHFNITSPPQSHHLTKQTNAHNTYNSQRRPEPSTQKPKNDSAGLGTSLLGRRNPFEEESDSSQENENGIRNERKENDPAYLFVNSDESNRSSQDQYDNNDEGATTDPYQEDVSIHEDDSYIPPQQAAISRQQYQDIDPEYSDTASPTPQYSSPRFQGPRELQRQDQSASTKGLRVRFNLKNASGRHIQTSPKQSPQRGRAESLRGPSRETVPTDQNHRRDAPPKHQSQRDSQTRAQVEAQEQDRAQEWAQPRGNAYRLPLDRSNNSQHHHEATQSPLSEEAYEQEIPSQAHYPRERSRVQTQGYAHDPRYHRTRDPGQSSEPTQSSPREVPRESVIPPRAQPSREKSRAHIDLGNHDNFAEETDEVQNESYPFRRETQTTRNLVPKLENYQSPTSTSTSPIDIKRPKPTSEFRKVKNLLGTINAPRTHDQRPRRPRFQEDIDYPSDARSFSPPVSSVTPAPPGLPTPSVPLVSSAPQSSRSFHGSSLTTLNSAQASNPENFRANSKDELDRFIPNEVDKRVRGWLHRKKDPHDPSSSGPMNWDEIKACLDHCQKGYILASVKLRQHMYAQKLAMRPVINPAGERQVYMQRLSRETAQSLETSYEREVNTTSSRPLELDTPAPLAPPARPAPQAAPTTPPVRDSDAARLADTLERERLDRQAREDQLQQREEELLQRIRTLEEESVANVLKLREQEKERKLKAEVEGKYHKLKEEAQTHKERLKDEHAARTKAERELKQAQTDAHRLRLAHGASTRKGAKAEGAGFAFPKDDSDTDKTPSKKKSRKAKENDNVELREDGHPRTAGKSLPPAAIQALYKHVMNSVDEEEQVQPPPETIQEPDLTYFVYTVHRKQWSLDDTEPSDDENLICGQYSYLNEANAEVTNEILRPHGNDGIVIDPLADRSLHQGVSDFNMAWAQLDIPTTGHVRVWVQRQLHTEFTGQFPVFEARGLLARTVFAIRQEISTTPAALATATEPSTTADPAVAAPTTATANTTSVITEDAEIYTTFDLANLKASEKLFLLHHGTVESQSKRYDDIQRRQDADRLRKQHLEDLEDGGELFDGEVDREAVEGGGGQEKVRIWVVRKSVVGPRN